MALLPKTLQKMAILVRTDLNMGQGKIASQCAHAAVECYLKSNTGLFARVKAKVWLVSGQPKVVLKVRDEEELLTLADEAEKAGLIVTRIKDAGRTQVKPGTITAVGIGPGDDDRVTSIVQDLKLL